jgi:hypothetical protein
MDGESKFVQATTLQVLGFWEGIPHSKKAVITELVNLCNGSEEPGGWDYIIWHHC